MRTDEYIRLKVPYFCIMMMSAILEQIPVLGFTDPPVPLNVLVLRFGSLFLSSLWFSEKAFHLLSHE